MWCNSLMFYCKMGEVERLECSKSYGEGVRYRRRECLSGLHCTGPVKEEKPCNVNTTCGMHKSKTIALHCSFQLL